MCSPVSGLGFYRQNRPACPKSPFFAGQIPEILLQLDHETLFTEARGPGFKGSIGSLATFSGECVTYFLRVYY